MHNSQWITFPTQSCLVLYSLCANLLHSLIIWLIVWSLSPHKLYLLRDELIRDVLLWTPTYGRSKAGRPARTYVQQVCEDTECSLEDLPEAMNDREKWWERVRDIHAGGTTWWWWWLFCCVLTIFVLMALFSEIAILIKLEDFSLLRDFYMSIRGWFLTGVWVIANLKSPGLFSVFWPILIIL